MLPVASVRIVNIKPISVDARDVRSQRSSLDLRLSKLVNKRIAADRKAEKAAGT
jgi:hypothetical protein